MTKEIILTAKYRTHQDDVQKRLKLVYYQIKEEPPYLELRNDDKTQTKRYESDSTSPAKSPIEDPRNPNILRANLKDLSRKLSDSGVFSVHFFEELNQRLEQNRWYQTQPNNKER